MHTLVINYIHTIKDIPTNNISLYIMRYTVTHNIISYNGNSITVTKLPLRDVF